MTPPNDRYPQMPRPGRSEQLVLALADPAVDPYTHLDSVRAKGRVLHLAEPNATWLVLGHGEVRRALLDDALTFDLSGRKRPKNRRGAMPLDWFDGGPLAGSTGHASSVRRVASRIFSPAGIKTLQPYISAAIDRVLDQVGQMGLLDLYHDVGVGVAAEVLSTVIGTPENAREDFLEHAKAFMKLGDPYRTLSEAATINRAIARFRRTAEDLISGSCDSGPGPLIEALLADLKQLDTGDRTAHSELARLLIQVMAAGVHTVASAISTVLFRYLSDAQARRSYLHEPASEMSWIMEALRVRTFVIFLVRVATATVALGEGAIAQPNDVVWLSPAAANRDPDVFLDPTIFDPARDGSSTLLFGWGRHYCLGAALAKLETRLALRRFVDSFPDAELTPEAVPYISDVFTRTPTGAVRLNRT